MSDIYLSVTYSCSECGEDAESDGDTGLICRRCCVRFDGYADGDRGEEMTKAEFVEWFGDQDPEPSRAEVLRRLLPNWGQR